MNDFLRDTFMGRILGKRQPSPDSGHHGVHHISPLWSLVVVFLILVFLTIITVSATKVDLGRVNIWIALFIAVIKSLLVTTYFMHLKHDRPFNVFIFYTCLALVGLFLGFALLDSTTYQPGVIPGTAAGMH
jgi:cytochrome c oxidase subunit 4